jgi:hypothetical protein
MAAIIRRIGMRRKVMKNRIVAFTGMLGWALLALSLARQAPAYFGSSSCPADISPPGGDGVVNVDDLLAVISNWGPCANYCNSSSKCDDGDPCTTDQCIDNQCQHTPVQGICCTSLGDCPVVPHAAVSCVGNQCVIAGCSVGWFNCDGEYENGCEWPSPFCP